MRSKIIIGCVLVMCVLFMWLITRLYHELLNAYEQSGTLTDVEYSWLQVLGRVMDVAGIFRFFRLLLNLAGYATVLLPGLVLYKYLHKTNYFDKITNQTPISRLLTTCFGEPPERLPETSKTGRSEVVESATREGLELAFCFTGLMGAYLVWGLLQEKIMTQNYVMGDGAVVRFNDSQLLVLVNRLAALLLAAGWLRVRREPLVSAPLHPFCYCALTNVLSAWCQYEALKYVSFPTQVLSKSCKVIPVMLMGKLISRNKYSLYEYVTAALISVGMVLFMFGSHDDYSASAATTASGVCLLCVYMVCDSFTSSWQGALFRARGCSALQMVVCVNAFSCALTAAALAHRSQQHAQLVLLQNPMFVSDCLMLSVSSAVGQLLIYRTISKFGAVVFTIIMTLRQALSILLSCVVYGHGMSGGGAGGVLLVLGAVLLRLYCSQRRRAPANI